MTKLGQDSAFPEIVLDDYSGKPIAQEHGISKRFYAACAAMQGIIASNFYCLDNSESILDIAFDAYQIADELIKIENNDNF